jgi:type II secretory pathway pseudopilin PulG
VTGVAAHLRREDGMTLVEVLVTCVLMLVVIGATLTSFNVFERNARANELQNEAQDEARRALELMSRDLRNLASPTPGLPYAIDVALPHDIVFQSEGNTKPGTSLNAQNTTRVRYCLDAATARLLRQVQRWESADAPDVPAGACGGDGWATTLVVASGVRNGERPIFTYNAVALDEITEVSPQVFVDPEPNVRPTEVNLQTAVFLRNQNRAPTAEFSWLPMPGGAIFLNASQSTDPEEKALTYEWWDASFTPDKQVGEGIVYTYPTPAPGVRDMYLVVRDATLETTSETKTVCATGPGVTCVPE